MGPTRIVEAQSSKVFRLLLILGGLSTLCILTWLLRYARYGIDYTDESFYLNWIANPFIYGVSITQFGFVYHPLYEFLGGSIAALRQASFLITFGLGWLLVATFLRVIFPEGLTDRNARLVVSAGFATSSLVFLGTWLPTPSYNSLALQALLVTATGMLLAGHPATRSTFLGWLLIGIGGWLAFMAKPSTAAGLAPIVAVYLLVGGKLRTLQALIAPAVAAVLLVVSALAIDGSVAAFAERIKTSLDFVALMEGGQELGRTLRLDRFELSWQEKGYLILLAALAFCATQLLLSEHARHREIGAAICAGLFLAVASVTFGLVPGSVVSGPFKGLLIFAVPLSAVATVLHRHRHLVFRIIPLSHWALSAAFLAFPHAYAFGTNRNYWENGSWAGLFWLLSGLALASPLRARANAAFFVPLAMTTQVIAVAVVHGGLEYPQRQIQPLWLNTRQIDVGRPGSALWLSEDYARYFEVAVSASAAAGFEPGTPVIDLTGQSPGILYAMRAESIGQPWTIGGYPGSFRLADAALRRVPCEKIATAWLLTEPDGPRSIPDDLLAPFGATVAEHYTEVARWKTAEGAGGYPERRLQVLLKPNRAADVATRACIENRPENGT